MEPRRDDGDDRSSSAKKRLASRSPQWSPVVTTGTTGAGLPGGVGDLPAAMEPRRDDGDDAAEMGNAATAKFRAAMEPRRDDGDDSSIFLSSSTILVPQWSPVVTTGTTRPDVGDRHLRACRNGAPVVTTGTTRAGDRRRVRPHRAAMEPRRDDGDDAGVRLRAVIARGCRNGAPS